MAIPIKDITDLIREYKGEESKLNSFVGASQQRENKNLKKPEVKKIHSLQTNNFMSHLFECLKIGSNRLWRRCVHD